ncbi:MAG: hypothetical protein JWN01_701 [Patescibacteria group bacterium]|jgi:hypothetical protein|nr:hypothetical protein [Patescibacteria group bacterium]
MREFDFPAGPEVRARIVDLAQAVFDQARPKRAVRAEEFAMDENPKQIVVHEVDLRSEGERMRIAATKSEARPPFEWLMEITSDIGETDYFKHYLVRENDIMLAQRKVLTPIDAQEAEVLLADLRTAQTWLD